jgi:hypothetical protein
MTPRCLRCGRKLTRPAINGMGPVCARSMYGAKPRRVKREDRRSEDERQEDLFYPEAAHPVFGMSV